ncbi:hemolysin family protein [Kangiella sediminilitoris]|uniref:CBS domain-containing protein n=1 Tax=Kangiella sediminilitoris TaxID=1144748 RepID=A0A1B3B7N7_9GAMM|nr:hemolysin family protein [Kangiella sediminilitoris]AOE48797.1 CBS domain-containing protein [Kangiella sediminilitoris]
MILLGKIKPVSIIVTSLLLLFSSGVEAAEGAVTVDRWDIILLSVYIFIALFFSFVCSIAEAVLLSITPSYIEHLQQERPKRAILLRRLRLDNVDRSLAAILTLNTIAHTVGAIVAGAKATVVFGNAWIGLFSALMTLAILFFSEIVPKTIGAVYWERLAPVIAVFVRWLTKALYPLIWISEGLTKLISKGKQQHIFSREEFLAMAGLGKKTGDIDEHESRIINNLFRLGSLKAKDIMTPRRVIHYLQENDQIAEVFNHVVESKFSRIPIYSEDIDDITAFVLKDDILMAQAQGKDDCELKQIQREMVCVLDEMSLPNLLETLLNQKQHIALVVDEYGDTRGLVTLEDLVETLLGMEIMDEVDEVRDMQKLAREQWLHRAQARGLIDEEIDQNETDNP